MDNILEIYNSAGRACTQGCSHCSRALRPQDTASAWSIPKEQKELVTKILRAFGKETKAELNITLAGNFDSWDLSPFERMNIPPAALISLGFWDIENWNSLSDMPERFGAITDGLPKDANTQTLLSANSRGPIFCHPSHQDILTKRIKEYSEIVRNGRLANTSTEIAQISISSNSLPEKDFDLVCAQTNECQQKIRHILSQDPDDIENIRQSTNLSVKGFCGDIRTIVQRNDPRFITAFDHRFICPKGTFKQSNRETTLQNYEKYPDFFVSVFPDKVMVHHSTLTVLDPFWWFTYTEFDRIISDSLRFFGKPLRHNAHKALRKRLTEMKE